MHRKLVQYSLSVILLICLAYKTTSSILHIATQEIEFVEQLSTEKETKEIEKLYEIEVFFLSSFSFIFLPNSIAHNYFDRINSLPLRHFQLHYPPPNV
ncbi:MAG: hypothetical protein ACI35V_01930 [Sphingobacterium composti]|uniref:hypothetical protein n=1 Tax=Sphingobacterium composti TaxID=363260 RepID=UPI00135CA7B1|nr:hypothetical protein [Sphingobacterium composti Ten et al. 2007 non Yoo et al. 2007]